MKHFFLSQQMEAFPQWMEAFPSAVLVTDEGRFAPSGQSFVWLLDRFPEAESLVGIIKQQSIPVVVLSLTPSVSDSVRFFEAGASGYCHALATPVMLHQVVESVSAGGVWIGVELMQQMVHRLVQIETKPVANQTHLARLTAKEKQVAELVVQGLSNKEVAKALSITERTVKAHLASTFEKLQVRDRIQLTLLIRS